MVQVKAGLTYCGFSPMETSLLKESWLGTARYAALNFIGVTLTQSSAVAIGLPYRGNPVVGVVGEVANMKQRKLWKTGEDGLCHSNSAIQTWLGPS